MPPGQPQQGPGAPGAAPAAFYPQQGYVPGLQQQQQQQQQLHAQGQYHQQQQYAQQHYAQQQPQLQQHQQPHQQYPGQNNGRPVVLSGANGRQIVIVGSVPVSYQTPVWRTILMSDLCGCFDDCTSCCIATWFPACLSGHNQSQIGGNCLLWCMCYPCAAGYGRQRIEAALGAPESSCCLALCLHWHCGICALTQEARALNAWIAAGRPSVVPPAVVVSV
jgi:Cys-rich protein (TIGR01571 family)